MEYCSSSKKITPCISIGTLERHETGEIAKAILSSIGDSEYLVVDSLHPVSQESKRNKNVQYKSSSSYKRGMISYNLTQTEKSSDKVRMKINVWANDCDPNCLPFHLPCVVLHLCCVDLILNL